MLIKFSIYHFFLSIFTDKLQRVGEVYGGDWYQHAEQIPRLPATPHQKCSVILEYTSGNPAHQCEEGLCPCKFLEKMIYKSNCLIVYRVNN